jgi:hypothetical protein
MSFFIPQEKTRGKINKNIPLLSRGKNNNSGGSMFAVTSAL